MTRVSDTAMYFVNSMTLLCDGMVVICGDEDDYISKIRSYNLQTGAELNCLDVNGASGMTEVKFAQKPALAVSFS